MRAPSRRSSPSWSPSAERRQQRASDEERTRVNRSAKQAILDAFALCREAKVEVDAMTVRDAGKGWELDGKAEAHRRTLEHYLLQAISNDVLVFECNACLQRLFEVRTALDDVRKKDDGLSLARDILRDVERRIDDHEPLVTQADETVRNGVTKITVTATGSALGASTVSGPH